MVDLTKFSVPMLYSRNKNTEYKLSIVEMSTSLLGFLKKENLISKDPFDENGNLKLDFVIKTSDLSPEGLELFAKAVPKWLQKNDRGGDKADVMILVKALAEIRGNI